MNDRFGELDMENKQRIIQEIVPGKQITLAHIIANPNKIMYRKLGLNPQQTAVLAGDNEQQERLEHALRDADNQQYYNAAAV